MQVSLQLPTALVPLDYFGIAVFAISGALIAAQKRQNVVTFIFFAVATGVGGGTLRDLLIGAPVFWVHTNATLLICISAALLVWLARGRWFAGKALLWFDAAGLAAYATYGTAKALVYGVAPVPAFAMGVLTGCAGGILRDVIAGDPSILMRPELYVTAAALSAGLFVGLTLAGVVSPIAALVAVVAGFALRGAAMMRGWSLARVPRLGPVRARGGDRVRAAPQCHVPLLVPQPGRRRSLRARGRAAGRRARARAPAASSRESGSDRRRAARRPARAPCVRARAAGSGGACGVSRAPPAA